MTYPRDNDLKHIVPKHIVAVSGLITNAKNEVLLILSPQRGWEFPGGQDEEGENIIRGLKREILEETDVKVKVGQLVGIYSNIRPPVKLMMGFVE